MKTLVVGVAMALALLAAPVRAGTPAAGFTDTLFASGFNLPVGIAFLPDGRLIVVEKGGGGFTGAANAAVKVFDPMGGTTTPLGTIPVCAGNEMGLLGVAVDPNFGANGYIYLYRTESGPTNTNVDCSSAAGRSNEVIRVTMSGNSIALLTVLLTGIRTDNGNHNGGALRYNPADGKLYVAVGDAGTGDNFGCPGDPTNPYARSDNALEGKILRLNLDGTIPNDNPFFGQAGKRGEIFALGFRNPFRIGFDPLTDNLWVGDVGDLAYEEIDIVPAGALSGPDYGWPDCEGTQPAGCPIAGTVAPIFTYAHLTGDPMCPPLPTDSLGNSITGGAFAGAAYGALAGNYVFGDFIVSRVYLATVNGTRDDIVGSPVIISTAAQGPVDIVTGPDGAIYYVALNAGTVRRLAPVPPPSDPLFGRSLLLRDDADPAKKRVVAVARDGAVGLGSGNGSADDPVLNGGSLRILTSDGCGGPCDDTYALPSGGWRYIGRAGENKGYRFRDPVGPIRLVVVRAGRQVRVVGRAAAMPLGHELAADPQPVDVLLTTGTVPHRYCMEYGGGTSFVANTRFVARNAPAPGACPF